LQLGDRPDVLERLHLGRMHLGALGDQLDDEVARLAAVSTTIASMLLARNAQATCSMHSSEGRTTGSADASIAMLGLILSSRTDGGSSSLNGWAMRHALSSVRSS
jgi:hypothetical protein